MADVAALEVRESPADVRGTTPDDGGPEQLSVLARSQLEHALDAHRRRLKVYESLKSLNEVIGAQYGDRVLFELVQNAHDAHPPDDQGEIAIRLTVETVDRGELLVANRGRAFTASNLEAIRNIGISDKEIGEGIGNKGLGFRSVEALTNDVRIYSSDGEGPAECFGGYCFRFGTTTEIAAELIHLGASAEEAERVATIIPRYLVPKPALEQSEGVLAFARQGFATVVALPLASIEAVKLARDQVLALADPESPVLLFLDRLAALDIAVASTLEAPFRRRLTRLATPVPGITPTAQTQMQEVVLDGKDRFLVARQSLTKDALLNAVRASIAAAPPLKRWLDWKGDAVVSVAVPLSSSTPISPRLFNFLPMDSAAVCPFEGHLDAPFFADIDRRSVKVDLPLNKYLLEAAARTSAAAALAIVGEDVRFPPRAVVDLVAWEPPHIQKIVAAFAALGKPLSRAAIWPVVPGGSIRWAGLDVLRVWPGPRTQYLTPRRVASVASAALFPNSYGDKRLARLKALALALSSSLMPNDDVLGGWTEAVAKDLASSDRFSAARWRQFYDDVVALYAAASGHLSSLEGRGILIETPGKLLVATSRGINAAPPVFVRVRGAARRNREGPPNPPPSISRKFRFLHEHVDLTDTVVSAFEKARLLRRYDPLEILGAITVALGLSSTDLQRRDALVWSFRVWSSSAGKSVEEALRSAGLRLPTLGGWNLASESYLSGSWSHIGRTLEQYLLEAASLSPDCAAERDKLLVSFDEWPRSTADDRRADWARFLDILAVRDGLRPVPASRLRRSGTPSNFWQYFLRAGDDALGLDARWRQELGNPSFPYPQTEYQLRGEAWRLPGQLEHSALPIAAQERLSELIIAYLREYGDNEFKFAIEHYRGWSKIELPTPLAIFLKRASWMAGVRRDEVSFATPGLSWSTTVARQIPPRFVARFAAEPGSRASLPPILFDSRVGLRDWSDPKTALQRLASLADALTDLSAAERRDLRDQLRRAWTEVADARLALPASLVLVVERSAGLELLLPDANAKPVVYVTSERQGFAARALADRGEAVLDVGDNDAATIRDLLEHGGCFSPRLADAGDVQLIVDGISFEADGKDPLLIIGELEWLADAFVLAHEHLGDPLELRNLPSDELERRLRNIRLRRCDRFALLIGGGEVLAGAGERIHPVPNSRSPTLLVAGAGEFRIELLVEAAQALSKLVGLRHNTLEMLLSRLMREGFSGTTGGPSEEQYARALRREVGVIRDHFAATRGGVERRVRALLPVVAYLVGRDVADRLAERHARLGQALRLREWLSQELGSAMAEQCLAAVADMEDQREIRRRMGFDFKQYSQMLATLDYPPLNDEADFRRLFEAFMGDIRKLLLDRVRRRFVKQWRDGTDLTEYVSLRRLGFVLFNPTWTSEVETLDHELVVTYAAAAAEVALGPDNLTVSLPDYDKVITGNRKLISSRYSRLASLVRAWCRKREAPRPTLIETADPQPLVRALDAAGLLDFELLSAEDLPRYCARVGGWPAAMDQSDDLTALGLVDDDLQHEEREAREARRRAELERRTIRFARTNLDTGADDFAHLFEQLAEAALATGQQWYERSRPPRLAPQSQRDDSATRGGGGGGGKGQSWQSQPPEAIRKAMGVASEWLAREYLKRRHPREMSDDCWVSSNRKAFCSGIEGDDSTGYDFRVATVRNVWLYEVKSALDEGGEFELTAREIEVAGSASFERKLRYRVLYVPFVFDPSRWRVLPLQNPVAEGTRNRFRIVRTGSVRYRFEIR